MSEAHVASPKLECAQATPVFFAGYAASAEASFISAELIRRRGSMRFAGSRNDFPHGVHDEIGLGAMDSDQVPRFTCGQQDNRQVARLYILFYVLKVLTNDN
jgi:hypothetical protein